MAEARLLIVVGASTGGLSALRQIVSGLSSTLPAALCVVQHIGAHENHLAKLLDLAGPLAASEARDGDALLAGCIYVAPPDRHLIVASGHLHLTRGPRENFARPAIDPLFRSAAEGYGRNAVGVVLTGQLNDGTAGLHEIKRRGGVAVVQNPEEAESPGMPRSAMDHVDVDHCVSASAMPRLFDVLAARVAAGGIAKDSDSMDSDFPPLQRPVTLTCPECGGAMHRSEIGSLVRFECHIGHSMTAESMAAVQFGRVEKSLEVAMRRMNERGELCRILGEKARAAGRLRQAESWESARQEAGARIETVRQLLTGSWILPEETGD